MDYVNRDNRGYVDFEKMIGLDGIAIINIVSNPSDAPLSGSKELQTRISHNDGSWDDENLRRLLTFFLIGGTWKPIVPPKVDSQGRKYECDTTVRVVAMADLLTSQPPPFRNVLFISTDTPNASTRGPRSVPHLFQV